MLRPKFQFTISIALLALLNCTGHSFAADAELEQRIQYLKQLCSNPTSTDDYKRIAEARESIANKFAPDSKIAERIEIELFGAFGKSNKSDVYFLELVRILFLVQEDISATLTKVFEAEDANDQTLSHLITKLGIELRKEPHANKTYNNPHKRGLDEEKIKSLLLVASKSKLRKVSLAAMDLLTAYRWKDAGIKPVDRELGLQLLSERFKESNDTEFLEEIVKRKIYFTDDRQK